MTTSPPPSDNAQASSSKGPLLTLPLLAALPITPPTSPNLPYPPPSPTRSVDANPFAQWSAPSSPAGSFREFDSDVESDAGGDYGSEAGYASDASEIPEGARTPKGHPVKGHRGKKGLGLGLGLGRFAFGPRGFTAGAEQSFSETLQKEKLRRESAYNRAPFTVNTTQGWMSIPSKVRISRRTRPALFGLGCLIVLLVYLQSQLGPSAVHKNARATLRRDQAHYYNDVPSRNGPATASVTRKRAAPQIVQGGSTTRVPAALTGWKWDTPQMEFAGLLSFMIAAEANTVPSYVDAEKALDPQLILDFDPNNPRAPEDLLEMRNNLWRDHPVVLLSKQRNAHSRFIKTTLAGLHIKPAPLIMDMDQRPDADVLLPLFGRLIGQSDLPILLVGGEVVGGWVETDKLIKTNALKPLIASHGGRFVPPKHKKKKSGHGGKSEEELLAIIEKEKKADEEKRAALQKAADEEAAKDAAIQRELALQDAEVYEAEEELDELKLIKV